MADVTDCVAVPAEQEAVAIRPELTPTARLVSPHRARSLDRLPGVLKAQPGGISLPVAPRRQSLEVEPVNQRAERSVVLGRESLREALTLAIFPQHQPQR
jgi:hypothetical protein